MIKLKNIVWAGAVMAVMTACDDYLSTPPVDALATDGFYQTAGQSEQGIIGVYGDLRRLTEYEYFIMSECRSNNIWGNPTPNGLREFAEIMTFRATNDLSTFDDTWKAWYKVIYDANTALAKIPGATFTDESIRSQFLNEAHFLRGWAYFELTRLFGDVPMVTEPLSTAEANQVPQSPARTIIDEVVIPDLKAALDLPNPGGILDAIGKVSSVAGRADKMAATAMLARVYMTLYGFPYNDTSAKEQARTYLKAVLDYSKANGDKYWAPNIDEWRKQWMPSSDYYNKYSIFAIQHRTGGMGNSAIFEMSHALPTSYTAQRIFGNEIFVEKSLMYEFERTFSNGETDGRGGYDPANRGDGYSILTWYAAEANEPEYTNDRDVVTVDGTSQQVYTKTMLYKYFPTKRKIAALGLSLTPETSMVDYDDWPVNYPVLRLEEMQLLYAELLVEDGDIAGAMGYVNDIRTRANCDLVETNCSAERAKYYIVRERRIEFLGEGIQWFDQIRRGTWKTDTEAKIESYRTPDGTSKSYIKNYLFPIPLNQMNITPGLYKQNEGY